MIYYDLETTGTDVLKDRIIEIYALKIKDTEQKELHHFVNPGIPIPKEASDVHGYTDDFVKDKPMLKDVIEEIKQFFEHESLCGYNIKKFDNLLLDIEFDRYGCDLNLEEREVVDVYEMWTVLEPRTLGGALKRFCNESSDELHGAKEDVKVVSNVLDKMIELFDLKEKKLSEITKQEKQNEKSISFGQLLIDDSGNLIINFGKKHPGKSVKQVQQQDPSFLDWIINQSDMNSIVKYHIHRELKKINKQSKN
jgi:DNA polymerase-3 subunit epsilon